MSVKFSNNATTELASSIGTSDTSITVVDGSKFPILTAGDHTYVTLDTDTASPTREIVRVTAVSGNVLTVTRGQDGTSPASFAAGTKVELRLTAALLNDVAGANPSGEPIGFPDKSQTTITFDSGIRTFSITPTGASFDVYCKGVKYTYTTVQLVTIPNTTGLHFIYFSASGVLSTQMSYFTWAEHAPTAYVYWNATTQQAIYFGDERHGITLDWQTHEYLHRTRGAAIANGFLASGYTLNNSATNAATQIAIESGTFFDEDMKIDIVSTATPTAGTYQQNLLFPAKIPVLHLQGTSWVMDAPTNFPFKQGTSRPQYNSVSGGVWSTADVGNNQHATTWILATNNLTYPVIAIIGQSATDNLGEAEAFSFADLTLIGFPSVEFRPLYKLIYKASNGYANSVNAQLVSIIDLRSISAVGSAANPATDHGNLSGLSDDDHPQYVHTSEVRTPSAAVKNSFFPSQVGQTGKFLSTDGTNTVWEPPPSGSLSFTGDVTGSGSTGSSVAMTLAASGVVAGQYTKVTVDSKGRVTAGTGVTSADVTSALGYTPYNATNPAGYTTNVGTVTSVSGTGTVSGLTLTGSVTSSGSLTLGGTLTLTSGQVTTALGYTPYNATNPSGYISGNQAITVSGDASGSGATSIALTLANSGVSAGTYTKVTVDAKGRVTSATTLAAGDVPTLNQNTTGSAATLTTGRTIGMTGDVTWTSGSFNGSANVTGTATLANSGVTAGTYTKVTVDAKGRVTTGASLASGDLPTYTGTITSGQVTTALGYTPYNSTNPSGYITSSSLSSYLPLSGGTLTGTLYFTDSTNGIYKAGGRLTIRSEATDDVANFASYGLYLPRGGQTAGLYVQSPIEARGGLRMGDAAGNGTITVGADTAAIANRLVQRDSGGDIYGRYFFGVHFNQSSSNTENPSIAAFWTNSGSDNYCRKSSPAHVISQLGLLTTSGGTISGAIRASQITAGGSTNTDANLGVQGTSHLTGTIYYGGTVGGVNSWSSLSTSSSGTHTFSGSRFVFDRYGYGSQPLIDMQSGSITFGQPAYAVSGITANSNGSAAGIGINLYSGSPSSPTYGLFFAQTGNFGTYGAVSADWATYFTMNSTANRGWIFREVETLGNVAAISNQGNMTIRSHFEQGNNIARPNVNWSAGSTSTGMVIFYLPGTAPANYGMIHMVFDIYEYNGNAVSTVIVGGHNWSTNWYNVSANVIGSCGKEVRLGVKDGRFCVVFGTSGSTWEYGTIVLRKIHNASFYDNVMDMVGNWSATQTTTESFTSVTGDLRALRTSASFNAVGAITQNGNQVLHAGNYTSYSPSLGGTGATGTWGINITGSANTVTNLNSAIQILSGGGGATFGANHYSMGKDIANGSWSHPHYSDLIIGYHTGIRLGAAYSGIRFYANSPTTDANNDGNGDQGEALLMTVGGYALGGSVNIVNDCYAYGYRGHSNVAGTGQASYHPAGIYSVGTNWLYGTIIMNGNGISGCGSINGSTPIHAGNYSSYALPLSGGTMSGAIRTVENTGIFIGSGVTTSNALRINFHTDTDLNYMIGKRAGAWTQPMDVSFYTGIRYHAHQAYGGHKFYSTGYDSTYSFSVGDGDSNVRVYNNLYVSGDSRGTDVYTTGGWFRNHTNNNGIYWSNTAWHLYPSNANDFYVRSGSSESTLHFITSGASSLGYLHCASDAAMGFLTSGRSWRFRVDNSSNVRCYNNLYLDQNYGHGHVGVYDSYRYQGVFFMGDSYKMSADGTSLANMYGIGWSHPNAGGAAGNLTDHGMLIINNGSFRCAISNSIVASGNITAYSDERLKRNWRDMPDNFVERLAQVRVGCYERIDDGTQQVGVSAQSLQPLLPEAIQIAKDEIGTLSVSYGNAAMASAVELAKELVMLKKELAEIKSRLH
jgi:hypothetical protein